MVIVVINFSWQKKNNNRSDKTKQYQKQTLIP